MAQCPMASVWEPVHQGHSLCHVAWLDRIQQGTENPFPFAFVHSVVPSTENLEVGARLAMQAAAMEADNMDPLGLGRIDTRQLALVREGPPKGTVAPFVVPQQRVLA